MQLFLTIKNQLYKELPVGFHPRVVIVNKAQGQHRHGVVVQLRTPTGKYITKISHLQQYCKESKYRITDFGSIRFRYYLKNYQFPTNPQLKQKLKIRFGYIQQILKDHHNNCFSHMCCGKIFYRKETYDAHRNIIHSPIICID